MKQIYLDNAATSFPKAPGVAEAMFNYITKVGTNIHRSSGSAEAAEMVVYNTRELICELFHFNQPENVIFTKNVTESLNLLIKGLLQPGDHALVSSVEHNAVMRPLVSLRERGVEFSRVPGNDKGELDLESMEQLIQPHTKAVIMTHASNVSGVILPLQEISEFCQKHQLCFIVDAAQTAGIVEFNLEEIQVDALAFTGHKSLLGPQGMGGFILSDRLAAELPPFIEGGTGSLSEYEIQPLTLPDKYESGTLNLPGIFGLQAALKYVLKSGVSSLFAYEQELTKSFYQDLLNIPGIKVTGPEITKARVPLISVDFLDRDNAEIANQLLTDYNIITRVGLHCAPHAHKTIGTFPNGTVRFSLSSFTTPEELKQTAAALHHLLKN